MTLRGFALVPVKDPLQGKSRLAGLLAAPERIELNTRLARQTFDCCVGVFGAQQTVAVTASDAMAAEAQARGMRVVREAAHGDLNAALVLSARDAIAQGAQALLVVPTDLVLLTRENLWSVLEALLRMQGCVLVPDRRGTGTNMLGIAPARQDLFQFGERSFERHQQAVRDAGLPLNVLADAALALDLDLPGDYELWRASCAR
jgi:2-phospho-L-lactate guanylyltransferase